MKKPILRILFIVLLTICSCKTKEIEKTEPNSELPTVEFTQYDFGESDLPKLKRQVNDFESIYTVEQLEKLTLLIRGFEKNTTNQIVIVSIESIGIHTDFDKFAVDLSNYNGIGLDEKDNGLTIVFSKRLKK
jgi:uncharacterized protein